MASDISLPSVLEEAVEDKKVQKEELEALNKEIERQEKELRRTPNPANHFSLESRINRNKQRRQVLEDTIKSEGPPE